MGSRSGVLSSKMENFIWLGVPHFAFTCIYGEFTYTVQNSTHIYWLSNKVLQKSLNVHVQLCYTHARTRTRAHTHTHTRYLNILL
jgi:hypothetical protein